MKPQPDPLKPELPGLGLPLKRIPDADEIHPKGTKRFPTALGSSLDLGYREEGEAALPLTTLREHAMLRLMNRITDVPDWPSMVFNDENVMWWKAEAMANPIDDVEFSKAMVDWVIEELRYKAHIFQRTGAVSVYNGDVVKSDSAIPEYLKHALQAAAAPLEQVLEVYKDYHRNTNETVLNLVHPSLFPLVLGETRVLTDTIVHLENCLERCGGPFSSSFQWLPCEVKWTGTGGSMKITSYINNLHPYKHKDLYGIIADIISRAVPLWNQTLTPLKGKDNKPLKWEYQRIKYDTIEYDMDIDNVPEGMGPPRDWDSDDDDADQKEADFDKWVEENKTAIQPEPGAFTPPPPRPPEHLVDLQRDFAQKGLQVIVKLANIHLTPENPEYAGETWHVEGQRNEHICATALYYYSSTNITPSHLAFCQSCEVHRIESLSKTMPRDHGWLDDVFGCKDGGSSVQELGDILNIEGRLLTFPNILQHRTCPFRLADATKPGHCKILALFLVDPNIRILSTANVPPQQRHWWAEEVERTGALAMLAVELREQVIGAVEGYPIGMVEAKKLRERLMEERRRYVQRQSWAFGSPHFSLCKR